MQAERHKSRVQDDGAEQRTVRSAFDGPYELSGSSATDANHRCSASGESRGAIGQGYPAVYIRVVEEGHKSTQIGRGDRPKPYTLAFGDCGEHGWSLGSLPADTPRC